MDPVHRALAEYVDELLAWDRAVRADADDAVHQMRVTIRKIRSLLEVSWPGPAAAEPGDHGWMLDDLRWLATLLGAARDAEVLAERYQRELDRLEPQLVRGPVRERLVDEAIRHYQAGRQRSLIAMDSVRYFRMLDGLSALIATPAVAGRPACSTPVAIDVAYRRVRKAAKTAAQAAGNADRDEALHRIRKGVKRLRYAADATGEPLVAARAKVIQTLLGDHQDSVVSRQHLLRQADAAFAAGEDTFSYGLLYQQESDLADRCRTQLDQALSELDQAVTEGGRVGL